MRRLIATAFAAGALVLPSQAWAAETGVEEVTVDGSAAASLAGCRRVDVARVGRDLFGFVVYKFHVVKTWCWSYPRVTSASATTYVSHVDPNMEYQGVISASGNYYTWCCSNWRSGHTSYRQARFDNCILWFPCTRREYPWVRINSHANGTFTYRTGT